MAKIKGIRTITNFDEYTRFELTEYQVLVFTDDSKTPPIVILRKKFEDHLGCEGRFAYYEETYNPFTGHVAGWKHRGSHEYWQFCPEPEILSDLKQYLQTL